MNLVSSMDLDSISIARAFTIYTNLRSLALIVTATNRDKKTHFAMNNLWLIMNEQKT